MDFEPILLKYFPRINKITICSACGKSFSCYFCDYCGGNPYMFYLLTNDNFQNGQKIFNGQLNKFMYAYNQNFFPEDFKNTFTIQLEKLKNRKVAQQMDNKIFDQIFNDSDKLGKVISHKPEYVYNHSKSVLPKNEENGKLINDYEKTIGSIISITTKNSVGMNFELNSKDLLLKSVANKKNFEEKENIFLTTNINSEITNFAEFDGLWKMKDADSIKSDKLANYKKLYYYDNGSFYHTNEIYLNKNAYLVTEMKNSLPNDKIKAVVDKFIIKIEKTLPFYYNDFNEVVKLIIFNTSNIIINYPNCLDGSYDNLYFMFVDNSEYILFINKQNELKDDIIEEKDAVIEEKDAVIEEKDAVIEEKDAVIEEKDAVIDILMKINCLLFERKNCVILSKVSELDKRIEELQIKLNSLKIQS